MRAIVRLANEHKTPLWPVARGKNLGYGGASPRMPGTMVLDLGRLNRILEVDEKLGYCVVEPGVGFFERGCSAAAAVSNVASLSITGFIAVLTS